MKSFDFEGSGNLDCWALHCFPRKEDKTLGKIETLNVPVPCILNDIYKDKPERGGVIQIVIPAISMAEKVVYQAWFAEGETQYDLDVDKETQEACFKHKGRKIYMIGGPAPVGDDTYTRVSTKYSWVRNRSRTPDPETHKITFYWRRIVLANKKSK